MLAGIAANPRQRIEELPLLTAVERRETLGEWNRTEASYREEVCLGTLFEEQVERTPAAVAVEYGERKLSYAELNGRSNQLARHLRELGVGAETLVGICVERSLEMVVGLLAVLKAGGAYVPLESGLSAATASLCAGGCRGGSIADSVRAAGANCRSRVGGGLRR